MVRKGQMHVLDAISAVIIILFFSLSNFGGQDYRDWSSYENKLAAKDLSHTLKHTGYVKSFLSRGETGNLKSSIEIVSARDFDASGKVQGLPPNLDIGFSVLPSDLSEAQVTKVESGDRCSGDLEELKSRSSVPIVRTEGGAGTMEAQHGDVRLYLGNYEGVTSVLEYNAIWIDNGTQCSFTDPSTPVRKFDVFEWGPSDEVYEFRGVQIDSSTWEGTLNLADAEQIRRFQRTMNNRVGPVNNRVSIDSFRIGNNPDDLDMVVFRGKESIQKVEQNENSVNELLKKNTGLFLSDLNESLIESGDFLYEQGFRWVEADYEAQNGASCSLSGPNEISPGCNLKVGFSDVPDSQVIKRNTISQETNMSDISIYPEGSVIYEGKTPVSTNKLVYLKNYGYRKLNNDLINKSMEPTTVSGEPSTSCDNVTTAVFRFPTVTGAIESVKVVNTQLGQSSSYCDRNNRAVYLDLNSDDDYTDEREGPYLDGETINVNGLDYRIRIYSRLAEDCGYDDCVGFLNRERAKLSIFNYNPEKRIGRAAYEQSFSETDRKVLSSFMYMIAEPMEIPSTSKGGGVTTEVYGVIGNRPYNLNLRWSD